MPLIETDAFVLNSFGLSEADKIVVLYTKEQGLIRAVAKGARRLNSKYGSSFELFSEINVAYFQKEDRELVTIQETELKSSLFKSIGNAEVFSTLYYFSELITSFMPVNDSNQTLYRLIKSTVAEIGSETDLSISRLYFEIWMLKLNGYLPEWNFCGLCKKNLDIDIVVGLASDLELICNECDKYRSIRNISINEREMMRAALKLSPFNFVAAYLMEKEIYQNMLYVTGQMIRRALNKEIKFTYTAT